MASLIPLSLDEVLSRVHQDDLKRAEESINRDREARKVLRHQSENPGLNISELVQQLAGEDPSGASPVVDLPSVRQEQPNEQTSRGSFPPPPLGPGEAGKRG